MGRPTSVTAASVERGNRVLRFHGAGRDTASAILTNVPRFRWGSFDVAIPDDVRAGPDGSLEVGWPDRKLLRLHQDGTLLFRAAADQEFLGWGQEPDEFGQFPRLNPVAVVEVHTSFVHLYRTVVEQLKETPAHVDFRVEIHNGTWEGGRLFLTKYYERRIALVGNPKRYMLQEDPATAEFSATAEEVLGNPNRTAFRLVSTFTSLFDMPVDEIPFTIEGAAGPEIDLNQIKNL